MATFSDEDEGDDHGEAQISHDVLDSLPWYSLSSRAIVQAAESDCHADALC
jgi:hypothetical protein